MRSSDGSSDVGSSDLARRRGCIAVIDLDHFKQVNDMLGHDEGDRVLADFASRLSSQTRRIDIIARWGGEEFAIFYQDAIEDEASWSLARIAERMRREPVGMVSEQPITFSAGLRSEEQTYEIQSLMCISYYVFCW